MYFEGLLCGVVCDGDDAVTVLKEVFEYGEMGLHQELDEGGWEEGVPYLTVDLAPCLILEVVVLKSLQAVNADVEIRGVEN